MSLRWEDGVPVSTEFDDPYYSRADGLAETRHVFLDCNGLPARWKDRNSFLIAELGFGTGLNFCAAWAAWEATQPASEDSFLAFRSFEMHPLDADEIDRALSVWPELDSQRARLVEAWRTGETVLDFGTAILHIVIGDARQRIAAWDGKADAWFLDGFAPARNPEMWEPDLLSAVARCTAPGGTFATYTAAGAVRRGLHSAGFNVQKVSGFGTKREMLVGALRNCDLSAYSV